ncbi:hypothetical protein C8024_03440 [Sphingopyxis sp. BSNA05]|uniref:hypothetical protein n=1 Tax=Sphingopyxis sp. BSNA05 TaxID=1236614 RepID=UPI0015654D1B|nr:hypothetical protein [Sphingopyxis sp. BSNA05]NRD88722.1 hypothetical protein [Sphingopyxis sp. BSNA05]
MKENEGGANLPSFLSAKNLEPFISKSLVADLIEPLQYQLTKGGAAANGIKAELLPDICGVWLAARARMNCTHRKSILQNKPKY